MINNILKLQPRVQEIANNLVFVHPEVVRHSSGWSIKDRFLADTDFGNWKDSLKQCHQLLATSTHTYDINVLNGMLDLKVKVVRVNPTVQTLTFRNITRDSSFGYPSWRVIKKVNGQTLINKSFRDASYKGSWEESLKAATTYLLKFLHKYSLSEHPLEYPKLSAFVFKADNIRLGIKHPLRNIHSYVKASELTQEILDDAINLLYAEWVWCQHMMNKFEDLVVKGLAKPEKLDHWLYDDFPKIPVSSLLTRVKLK
ncbi:hypothetical protein [Ewingella americana]|uniref:Uncharacterized protein n=1 Tax=Ewingella americana TaxID=41202 RepID=A0A502GFD0_9GAMM|nr:hypothetical protein [Ewingella americana]TPG59990.1 hypothetical protein EAH77_15600 [Ewingella americana]